MKKLISATIVAILVSGCASESELRMAYDAQVRVAEVQATNNLEQPTMTVSCTQGCDVKFLDPRDRTRVVLPKVTGTNDVIVGTAPSALSAVKWIAGFWAGTQIVNSVMDGTSGSVVNSNQTVSGENNVLNTDRNVLQDTDYSITEELENEATGE